jgi:SP family sugar:H+ symporter-like MFS transporter
VGGLGVGAASVISPIYVSEVVPARIRGRLSSVQQVMIIAGLTAAFVANYVLAARAGGSTKTLWLHFPAWRWMFWMQAAPATIYLLALFAIPESPRWLVLKGRDREAEAVIARLSGSHSAAAKVHTIRGPLAARHQAPRLSSLVDEHSGKIRKIVWSGIGLAVFQQLSGIVAVFYYGAMLWRSVGFSEHDALKINILSGALSILACLVAVATIDRIGRKPLLLAGALGMAVSLGVMAACFSAAALSSTGVLQLSQGTGMVALVAANLFAIVFNGTWGPVMWVMLGEMFPNRIRGSALAVCGGAQWAANFLMSVSFPVLAAELGLVKVYGFYASCALLSFFFVRRMVSETQGRELEEMEG